MKRRITAIVGVLLAVVLIMGLMGCGSSASSAKYAETEYYEAADTAYYDEAYTGEVYYEAEEAEYGYDNGAGAEAYDASQVDEQAAEQASSAERKLIQNINISAEVNNPSLAVKELVSFAEANGGYVLYSDDWYDEEDNTGSASVTLRLPTGTSSVRSFIEDELEAEITSYATSSDDVTDQYYDLQTRIAQGEQELEALSLILEKCETVEEVLAVRSEIASLQSDVESMKGSYKRLSELTSYDTYNADFTCHPNMVSEGTTARIISGSEFAKGIKKAFGSSVRALVNGAAYLLIFIVTICLPAAAIGLIVLLVLRLTRKRRAARRERKAVGNRD